MIALGIDPSYTCSGLVWLESQPDLARLTAVHFEKIKIPVTPKRLVCALIDIKSALNRGPKPDTVGIEDTIWTRRDKGNELIEVELGRGTVKKMIELNAIYKLLIQDIGFEPLEASPSLIKLWLTGNGHATKQLVAQELQTKFGISFQKDAGHDLSDAAALAAWILKRV